MEKKSTDPPAKRKIHDSLDSASSAYDGGLITNSSKRPKAPSSRESIVPPRHPGSSYSADKNGGRHLHTHKTRDPDGFVASGNQTSYSTPNERRETTQVPGRVASDPPSFRAQHKTSTPPAVSDPSPAKTRSSRRSSDRKESEGSNVEFISTLVSLPELSQKARLTALSVQELSELEVALEITEEDGWREDWSGNLAFTDKEVLNPKKTRNGVGTAGTFRQPLYIWAQNDNPVALRIWHNLFRYVYHLKDTPAMAKTILANADAKDSVAMEQGFRRVSYDPKVLQQDGWTTAKASEPVGATGGAYRIGDHVRWQGSDGIVIAYIHDQDLGDLWRGIWLDEALECFDMEAEELHDARKKWERRAKAASGPSSKGQKKDKENQSRRSHRYSAASDFQVNGVEHGIVLAASFARGARPGVYWPARVMHASEAVTSQGGKSRRGAPRQRLDLVFLAPYWNSPSNAGVTVPSANSRQRVESFAESLSRHGESLFSTGPLFDVESVDVSDEMIEEYPYDGKDGGINIDQLRVAFRFTGLPKAAFPRFLDSHRLALALKTFAQERLPPRTSDQASAGLFETHPMSVLAPMFPPEVLHLPYPFILSQLPPPPIEQSVNNGEQRHLEPILRINTIVSAMKPPSCWGKGMLTTDTSPESPSTRIITRVAESPYIDTGALLRQSNQGEGQSVDLDQFIRDLLALKDAVTGKQSPALEAMFQNLQQLLSLASPGFADVSTEERKLKSRAIVKTWVFAKTHGEDAIGSLVGKHSDVVLSEWRRACERVYKYITHALSSKGFGNGVSAILTDFRCNQHVTSCGCFERAVRLPAALKAARDVGAGKSEKIQVLTAVEKQYVDIAENKVLMKAHSTSYLRRMKGRCSQIQGDKVAYLTEDSDGNGGEDTKGSRGTWTAAITCVGAAIKAVDMVVNSECVNVFCATRPPGHHAGRDVHPMKAVSNGFCILNAAACAALHATTPISEGGPGLRRVCVIDFDVHHGNGTQDILCSTYDPRFLYVSLHAGGAHVNGLPASDEPDSEIQSPGGSQKKGIYPGRCGDTSPHKGVLNIPLGPKVTSHAVGTAIINQVTPTVEAFCPDLIVLSAGFDGHKNDPLGLGGLSAADFEHITDVACQIASRCCSGRLISIMEGGYGVPCCRPQTNLFLPKGVKATPEANSTSKAPTTSAAATPAVDATTSAAITTAATTVVASTNGETKASIEQKPADSQEEKSTAPQHDKQTSEVKGGNECDTVVAGGTSTQQIKDDNASTSQQQPQQQPSEGQPRPQPSKLMELGDDLPPDMDDQVPYALQRRLEKCHAEGFMDCVRGHVKSLSKCSTRS